MMTASEFARLLTQDGLVAPGDHVLAAVSGGADSVALLCLLCDVRDALHIGVSCAHVEHGIRGDASLRDMDFVRALCDTKGIPFYARRVDAPAYARAHGAGLEDAARTLRRAALLEMAEEAQADVVALAHHAGDQAETLLLHAARGSDVRGLCAMRMRSGRIIRPLLDETPQSLRAYLARIGQPFCEDETNGDVTYARNRIRLEAMPAITTAYPGAVRALGRLAQAAQRDEDYFAQQIAALEVPVRRLVDGAAIERGAIAPLHDALSTRVIAAQLAAAGFGAQSAETVYAVAQAARGSETATVNLTGGAHAHIGERYVAFVRETVVEETPLALFGRTQTPFGAFTVREAAPGETGDGIAAQAIDESMLVGASISMRRAGDAMTPFGRTKPVKLKKLMIDAGVERPIRNSLPVLRRGDQILWAVGLRPSSLCAARGGRRLMVTYEG